MADKTTDAASKTDAERSPLLSLEVSRYRNLVFGNVLDLSQGLLGQTTFDTPTEIVLGSYELSNGSLFRIVGSQQALTRLYESGLTIGKGPQHFARWFADEEIAYSVLQAILEITMGANNARAGRKLLDAEIAQVDNVLVCSIHDMDASLRGRGVLACKGGRIVASQTLPEWTPSALYIWGRDSGRDKTAMAREYRNTRQATQAKRVWLDLIDEINGKPKPRKSSVDLWIIS